MKAAHVCRHISLLCFVTLFALAGVAAFASGPAASSDAPSRQAVVNYGKLPLSFEMNKGQTDARVKFLSRGSGYTLFLAGDEAVLALRGSGARGQGSGKTELRKPDSPRRESSVADSILRMQLEGANLTARVSGADELPGKSSYFIGNDPTKWRTNVPTYSKVKYEDVYPGVDLVYYGNQGKLEYDFIVAPGADPAAIKLDVAPGFSPASGNAALKGGATRAPRAAPLRLDANGDLVVKISGGEVRFRKPVVYQPATSDQQPRTAVDGRYRLTHQQVTFEVGSYDKTRPLVIDPALAYSTYLGGSTGINYGIGIAVDQSGDAYITGYTSAIDFPVTGGAFQTSCKENSGQCAYNAFVTKLNASGSGLVYSTYLGGSAYTSAYSIALDASADAYVAGITAAKNFPTTPGAFQTTCNNCDPKNSTGDGFVTELNPSGSALNYSTYLSGSNGNGQANSIAIDTTGEAYVTGSTYSATFPTTPGAFDTTCNACGAGYDAAFVTKFNATGSALVYSTYLGGSSYNGGFGLTLDTLDNAYVTGFTDSSDFPTSPGAFQATCDGCAAGYYDAFVTKLNPSGSTLIYSTFLGGSGPDEGMSVALDSDGDAYLTGSTSSTNFPVTPGAFQTTCENCGMYSNTAFVTEFNPSASALIYSTYLSGSVDEAGSGIAVDSSGQAYVTGGTQSADFPITPGAFQTVYGGGVSDAFLTQLNASGTALVYSTFLGGPQEDAGSQVALDSAGNAYLTGLGEASFPVTPGAFQTSCFLTGGYCAYGFVTKFTAGDQVWPSSLTFPSQTVGTSSAPLTTTFSNSGTTSLSITGVTITGTNSSDFTETNTCGTSLAAGATCAINVTFTPIAAGSRTATLTITDAAQNSPQTVSLSGTGAAPTVTLTPTSLVFGSQNLGTTSPPQTVTLGTNGVLSITSITTTAEFTETNNCGTSVAAGGSCTIMVTFTPTASGTQTGTLSVSDDGIGSPQTVALSGTGVGPTVKLNPAFLNFGNQTVGIASAAQTTTLTNTGNATLSITSIGNEVNNGSLTQTSTCGSTLVAGASCTISVAWTPSVAGPMTGTITVTDNAFNSPQTVSLSGTGVLPAVTFAPASLTFTVQLVFTASQAQTVKLTNTGIGILTLNNLAVSGNFTETNTCGPTLEPEASCLITVTFRPENKGALTGSVTVTDNAPGSPQSVSLTGTGTYVLLSPSSVSFGSQPVGSTSLPRKIGLTNKGGVALGIASIAITGTDAGDFAETNTCGTSVARGESCSIMVTFTPSAKGERTAEVSITDNGGSSPQTAALTGLGTF